MIVKKGDLLLKSSPVVWQLNPNVKGTRCDHCFKSGEVKKCSACKIDSYCGTSCQKAAWNSFHRYECPELRDEEVVDGLRLLAKVLIFLKNGGHDVSQKIDDNCSRKFSDLQTHKEVFEDPETKLFQFQHFATHHIERYLGKGFFDSKQQLIEIFGALCVNSYSICDTEHQLVVGNGLYLNGSVFDHSCRPNAIQSFQGTQMSLRVLEDIEDFSLDKITVAYTDVLDCREDRRKYLKDKYYFDCHCTRCDNEELTDMENALNCGNPLCDNIVYIKYGTLQCSRCLYNDYPQDTAHKYKRWVDLCKESVVNCFRKLEEPSGHLPFAAIRQLINLQNSFPMSVRDEQLVVSGAKKSLCNAKNLWRTKILDEAMGIANYGKFYDEAHQYGVQNIEGMRFYHGEYHSSYGMYLVKLGELSVKLDKNQDAVNYFTQALTCLSVCLGRDNRIIDKIEQLLHNAKGDI